jgi:methionine-rich copper-binding protein CopC
MISVTPNPAKNDISVNVQLNENSFIVMKVISTNGTEVMKKSLRASAGSNSYILEGTSKLQRGLYVLEVIVNSKERMVVKLMKE